VSGMNNDVCFESRGNGTQLFLLEISIVVMWLLKWVLPAWPLIHFDKLSQHKTRGKEMKNIYKYLNNLKPANQMEMVESFVVDDF